MYVASNGIKTAVILQDSMPENPRTWDNVGTMICWHRRYNLGDKHNYDDSQEFAEALAKEYLKIRDVFTFARDGRLDGYRLTEVEGAEINGERIGPHYQLEVLCGLSSHQNWDPTGWRCTKDLEYITSGGHDFEEFLEVFNTRSLLKMLDASDKVAILPVYLYDHSGLAMSTGSFVGRAHHAEWDSGQVGFIYMDKDTAMKELAMEADTLKIAMLFSPQQLERFTIRTGPHARDTDLGKLMKDLGYTPVLSPEHIKNLYGQVTNVVNPDGLPLIDPAKIEKGKLFKKDRTLYEVDGRDEDGSVRLHNIATFNPDLKRLTEETWKGRAEEVLKGEVETYDAYLRGEVYGYQQYEGLDETDSCWGYNPGSEDICSLMKAEMFGWLEPGMSFSYESGEDFDIDEFYANNDFPELRAKILGDVKSFITFEAETSQIYPFATTAEDILSNKDGILDEVVEELYGRHMEWNTESIYEVVQEHAGIARSLQPKLSVADLDPSRDYTADELMAIIQKKPSLNDQIAGAAARLAGQAQGCNDKGLGQER